MERRARQRAALYFLSLSAREAKLPGSEYRPANE